METFSPPAVDLSTPLYYQLVCTLTGLLPPPLDHTPEALRARNIAAIAKVAALLPVNANEADLAAQCIAARAQAEDILRLLRQHEGDIALVMRLNAQYASMQRTALSLHGRLMRVQALRHKRDAIEGAANQDAWVLHVAERSMLPIVNPAFPPGETAWPKVAPTPAQPTLPEAAPAACEDQRTHEHVSEDETNSHDTAFETWLSDQPWTQPEADPHEFMREAIARSRPAKSDSPKSDSPRSDSPKSDSPRSDSPRSDSPRLGAPRLGAPRLNPQDQGLPAAGRESPETATSP